jgi:phospholipid/cholesterol/gamma-HCH transport system substrate-binding protein
MEMVVGTFTFVVLLALGYFTIIMGHENLFQKQYPFTVRFDTVLGLRKNDDVLMRGMKVGQVKRLQMETDHVVVTASLDHQVALRKGYRVTVVTSSILGGRYMEIDEGPAGGERLAEGEMAYGESPSDLVADASEAVASIRKALMDGGVLTNLQRTVASAQRIADGIERGEGTIGKLVADDSVFRDLQQVGTDLKDVSQQLKDIAGQLSRGEGTLGRLMSKDDTLYKDLAEAVASLKGVAGRIERGEGSIGKIATDPALYDDLKAGIGELRAAIDDYRETSPVVSFSSLLFGAF